LQGHALEAVDEAIRNIEADPRWGIGTRLLASAESRNPGTIIDFSPRPFAIFYKIADKGTVVHILKIQPVIF
jgi:hypothetical protein